MKFRRKLQLLGCGVGSILLSGCGTGDASPPPKTGSGTTTGNSGTSGDPGGPTGTTGPTGAGGATSTTTGVIIGGGGGPAGGAGGGTVTVNPDAACIAEPRVGEQKPIDLYFMVDKSGSMNCGVGPNAGLCLGIPPANGVTRWTSITQALNTFVGLPENAGTGMGMAFFPWLMQGTTNPLCNVTDYNMANVPIAPLPGNAQAITAAIAAQMPSGGTPTTPALTGALEYARAYAAMHLERAVAVVFATDGEPMGCNNNTVQTAAQVAAAAAMASPPVRTYVLGVGPSLFALNQIAQAGGTGMAFLVESGGAADLIKALDAIRKSTLSCDYKIPTMEGGKLDYGAVNVETRVGPNGTPMKIPPVANPGVCGPSGGWYYDNPTAPTQITLCPATCDPLTTTPGSSMNVLIGCRTIPPIVD